MNISNLTITSEVLPLTRSELANVFCNNVYSYLITISLFIFLYFTYEQELKQYVDMFTSWFIKKTQMKDPRFEKHWYNIGNDISWVLRYVSMCGIGFIIYFYYDYMTFTQKFLMYFLTSIFIIHRIFGLIEWGTKKVLMWYAMKQVNNMTKELKDYLQIGEEDEEEK